MQILRPAGHNEHRCIIRERLGLYGSIVTVGTYTGPSFPGSEKLTDIIIKALKQCIVQHPVLSTVIQDAETEHPQLGKPRTINLDDHVRTISAGKDGEAITDRLHFLLSQAHNEPWSDHELTPLWRAYILPLTHFSSDKTFSFHLAFAISHALSDGFSGLLFHRTFLEALEGLERLQFDEHPVWDLPSHCSLPPPLEEAGTFSISWSFLLGPLMGEYLPPFLRNALGFSSVAKDAWYGAQERPVISDHTHFPPTELRVRVVPGETLAQVLDRCRSNRARLTGLLNHLTAYALVRALRNRGQSYSRFITQTPLDLRRCLSEGKHSVANYISAATEDITVDTLHGGMTPNMTTPDWKAVQRTTERLRLASSTLTDHPVALLKYLSNFRDWTLKNSRKPATSSFSVSNVGSFDDRFDPDMANQQSWRIEDMAFSQSADGTGAPLNVNVASARQGRLAIVMTWWPGMLGVNDEVTFVEEVCDQLVSQLQSIASE